MVIPILPFFIATTFCGLAYEGTITRQLPVFLAVVLIVIVGHYIWLAILYGIAGALFGRESVEGSSPIRPRVFDGCWHHVIRCDARRCASGRQSRCASAASRYGSFGIPLFANIHLCGSVLTEVFFVMTIGQMINGSMPELSTMIFCSACCLAYSPLALPAFPAAPLCGIAWPYYGRARFRRYGHGARAHRIRPAKIASALRAISRATAP